MSSEILRDEALELEMTNKILRDEALEFEMSETEFRQENSDQVKLLCSIWFKAGWNDCFDMICAKLGSGPALDSLLDALDTGENDDEPE